MASVRFLGDEPHIVPVLDRIVEPDELVTVPDDVFAAHAWGDLWEVVTDSTPTKDEE